jgi:dUTP pyrophosphatase
MEVIEKSDDRWIISFPETIKIKYHYPDLEPISQAHDGEWFDLRSAEDVKLKKGEFKLIDLGVSIALPEGYEAILAPRSSTFKKYKIIQVNGVGIIDSLFRGENDRWMMPVLAMRDTFIPKNDRICQFRIIETQPPCKIEIVDHMEDEDRGGHGSTGTN